MQPPRLPLASKVQLYPLLSALLTTGPTTTTMSPKFLWGPMSRLPLAILPKANHLTRVAAGRIIGFCVLAVFTSSGGVPRVFIRVAADEELPAIEGDPLQNRCTIYLSRTCNGERLFIRFYHLFLRNGGKSSHTKSPAVSTSHRTNFSGSTMVTRSRRESSHRIFQRRRTSPSSVDEGAISIMPAVATWPSNSPAVSHSLLSRVNRIRRVGGVHSDLRGVHLLC